jgi:hypothetical protein
MLLSPIWVKTRVKLLQQGAPIATAMLKVKEAPPVKPFALIPALSSQDVVDMATSVGIKLYNSITTPLATKFNGSYGTKMILFLDKTKYGDPYGAAAARTSSVGILVKRQPQ